MTGAVVKHQGFDPRVAVAGPADCWPWTGARKDSGYGVLSIGGRLVRAHRAAWEAANGLIPEGLCVCHRCDNPPCCNPAHLFLGTYADNNRDMARKGRAAGGSRLRGDRHHRARLSDAAVAAIRSRHANGETQRRLAAEFGISTSQLHNIVRGKQRNG